MALVSRARFGELVGLTKNSFDFKNNTISIKRAWDYKDGTGFAPLKNEQSERTISIDNKVMNEFKKLILALHENPYDTVFFRPTSKKSCN